MGGNKPPVLAVIGARAGSKGVPGKNLKSLGGRPLIAWTITAALRAELVDRVVLSSDDAAIRAEAERWGCHQTIARPPELAHDETPIEPVVLHALDSVSTAFDWVALLHPTVPYRSAADIDGCIRRCVDGGAPACVTLTKPAKSPYWMFGLDEDGRMRPVVDLGRIIPRRQELPAAYALNGAVYVARTDWFRRAGSFLTDETVGYIMPPERSVDIDTPLDFRIAEALLSPDGGA